MSGAVRDADVANHLDYRFGLKRAVKTCPRWRQLSPKAAMAAPFPRSRLILLEQGEAGRPVPCGRAGQHAFSGTTLVRYPPPFQLTSGAATGHGVGLSVLA
jgi:hypothetical protein